MRYNLTENASKFLRAHERFCVVLACSYDYAEDDGNVNYIMSCQSKSLISIVVFMLEKWVQNRFQKSPFSSVHTKTKRFQKSPLSKAFSKVSVFGGNDSTHSSFTCGRKAKTDKKICVFLRKRIHLDSALGNAVSRVNKPTGNVSETEIVTGEEKCF